MLRVFSLCLLAGLFSTCTQSPNSPQLPKPGGSPKIFESYSASGNSTLAQGWSRGFDMSGVSFNDKRTCTLITPRHVIMAKHYKRPINSQVVFHNRKGKVCVRYLHGIKDCIGDTAVGLLDEPVPAEYSSYPLPWRKSDHRALIDEPIAVTDQNKHLFFHRIGFIGSGRLSMKHDPKERHGWGKNLIVGDSGNPSFVIANNKLVLVETHHTGGPGAGPYFGDDAVQQSISDAIKALDPSYELKVQTVGQ